VIYSESNNVFVSSRLHCGLGHFLESRMRGMREPAGLVSTIGTCSPNQARSSVAQGDEYSATVRAAHR